MHRIQAVIFDWGGVLIDTATDKLMEYFADSFGVGSDDFREVFSEYLMELQKGFISESELWDRICPELNAEKPKVNSLWKGAVNHIFQDKKEIYRIVEILKKGGYKTGFLSNTEVPAMEYFYKNEYERYFDAVVFSCAEGTVKPEKKIYSLILEKLQVEPQEAILIDDDPLNIDGAERAGINGILFRSKEDLVEKLNEYSIEVDKF